MNKKQTFVFGSVTMLLLFGGMIGFWDLTRHQVELTTGFYDLPFQITVPWYIAGDLFGTMIIGSMVLVWYMLLHRKRKAD